MEEFKRNRSVPEEVVGGQESSRQEQIEILLSEFPKELSKKLELETDEMSEDEAATYLTNKLTARREVLNNIYSDIEGLATINETPDSLRQIIDTAMQDRQVTFLGSGKNGEVFLDRIESDTCYKVLFLQKVEQLQVNIFKEASFQHRASTLLNESFHEVRVPEVRYVIKSELLHAVAMERVEGWSLSAIFDGKEGAEFPSDFLADVFFEKLERAILLLNERGYFHCDLTNNAGNVMIDKEGTPWIIDFGAMVKSVNPDHPLDSYQLQVGGRDYRAQDVRGIGLLKQRVIDYLNK